MIRLDSSGMSDGLCIMFVVQGCLLGNWLVMSLLATALFTFLALHDGPHAPAPSPPAQGMLGERLLGQAGAEEGEGGSMP